MCCCCILLVIDVYYKPHRKMDNTSWIIHTLVCPLTTCAFQLQNRNRSRGWWTKAPKQHFFTGKENTIMRKRHQRGSRYHETIFVRCDRAIPARWSQKWFCLSSWKQKETQTELVKWDRPERNQKPFWWRSPNHLCSIDWQFWLLTNLLLGHEAVRARIIVSWSERHSPNKLLEWPCLETGRSSLEPQA